MNNHKLEVSDHFRPTAAIVDLKAIQTNFMQLRAMAAKSNFICPMVKANAYGHGAVEVTQALCSVGAERVGVVLIEEGIGLRESGVSADILLFGLFSDAASSAAVIENRLTAVVSDQAQLESLSQQAKAMKIAKLKIHLKFNTGMNRLGFSVGKATQLQTWLQQNPHIQLEGICTHFLRGDDAGTDGDTEKQVEKMHQVVEIFQGQSIYFHALNSGALAGYALRSSANPSSIGQDSFEDELKFGVRPGISLYGAQPTTQREIFLPVKPVMHLETQLSAIHHIEIGQSVSYNATWRAQRRSVIGVLPIGYADGYRRAFSNKSFVLCRGKRAPVVGVVCMDFTLVDLTDVERIGGPICPGENVVLIGKQGGEMVSAEELAHIADTIPYEIFTGISDRVPRRFVGSPPL